LKRDINVHNDVSDKSSRVIELAKIVFQRQEKTSSAGFVILLIAGVRRLSSRKRISCYIPRSCSYCLCLLSCLEWYSQQVDNLTGSVMRDPMTERRITLTSQRRLTVTV